MRPGLGRREVAKAYNVSGIPSYFLVDPKGMIVERQTGQIGDVDGVVAKIEKTLGRFQLKTAKPAVAPSIPGDKDL